MLRVKAYQAGIKPGEFYDLTLKEVLYFIDAYDKNKLDLFNWNAKVVSYYVLKASTREFQLPSFENFMNSEGEKYEGEDLQDRIAKMRQNLINRGLLKPKAIA